MIQTKNRKTAVRLLMINWSRFQHIDIKLDGSTLFTGVNGSGKSTILDAMTYLLTGNTQFNKAAKDKDRTVLGYVKGDTKSNGDSRFLRNGQIISYIAMEFDSPVDNSHLVVGVCIEVSDATSDRPYWFICRNAGIDDINFCEFRNKHMIVTPHGKLENHGRKLKSSDFLGRDKARIQILRALGLRCDEKKYRTKLLKMMAFNPENDIDKFIQDCVLEAEPVESLRELREQKELFERARQLYLNLQACKDKLEKVEELSQEYEKRNRNYQLRDLMLYYQETIAVEEDIDSIRKQIQHQEQALREQERKQDRLIENLTSARERLETANTNDVLVGMNKSIEGLKEQVSKLEKAIEEYEKDIRKLKGMQEAFCGDLSWLIKETDDPDGNRHILHYLGESGISSAKKAGAFLAVKAAAEIKDETLSTEWVHLNDSIGETDSEIQVQLEKIAQLEANILQFPACIERAKRVISSEFEKLGIHTDIKTLAEYVDRLQDEKWRAAIETFLGKKRYYLIVDGKYCKQAIRILKERNIHDATVVITDKLEDRGTKSGSAAEQLVIHNVYARRYANYLLNGIHLCADLDELHDHPKGGLTKEGMLAKSFAVSFMDIGKTEMCLGQGAIRLQKKNAEEKMKKAELKKKELLNQKIALKKQRDSLNLIQWNDSELDFSAPDSFIADSKKKAAVLADIEKYENDPVFMAVLAEQQKANELFQNAVTEQNENAASIKVLQSKIEDLGRDEKKLSGELSIKQDEYKEKKYLHLELNRPMREEYEKLRVKSTSARVITAKYVREQLKREVEAVSKSLEDAQIEYCKLAEMDLTKRGPAFIAFYRKEYSNLAAVRIEEARNQMKEKGKELESAFMRDFIGEISEAIRSAEEEIDAINAELKQIPFGLDTYKFVMTPRSDRLMFFKIRDRLMDYADSADFYLSTGRDDEEMEHNIQEFMDRILTEEDETEYTDYRKYFTYDMTIIRRQGDVTIESDLSKKQGSASNGEKQTPYFIILAASLMQCYPKSSCCMRLAFIDEAFSALSRERIEQMVKYFEENNFQVIYAAPPEKISSIGQFITSTVSLFTSGNYTYAIEGQDKTNAYQTY
ncbi:MAG: AAA family ATPase [Lachnospiraceae bacterium]|nr:AAA family ATPase [Lachnospiraceae bacterium]